MSETIKGWSPLFVTNGFESRIATQADIAHLEATASAYRAIVRQLDEISAIMKRLDEK